MFCIKICGVTTVDDARAVVEAGADAVGLNFYPKSPRCIGLDQARRIIAALPDNPDEMAKVGLFVNAAAEDVCRTFDQLGLDLIQLHGDEPPEYLVSLAGRPVMRAFRLGQQGLRPVGRYLEHCQRLRCAPRTVLIDSHVEGVLGGSGQVADWRALQTWSDLPPHGTAPPMVLAGGLTPENVAEAIRTVCPAAVDTASGVESAPGRKDRSKVEAFVRAARAAFDSL
ncbi:MAG: hypothetical protein A2V70_16860 [Planctomycetes bacterium RBG_13_63_9]|nr:MAG: hypothetical protein A2V70_16860 [Planctomycetes bacterium RBG_13_63_9]